MPPHFFADDPPNSNDVTFTDGSLAFQYRVC